MKRERIDTHTAAITTLATVAMLSLIVPEPWPGIVASAGVATVVALVFARYVLPKPTKPQAGHDAPLAEQPATQAVTTMRANVTDMIEAYQLAGFSEDDAKKFVREQLIAQQPNPRNLRSVNGGDAS